jgi:hypothetical protein
MSARLTGREFNSFNTATVVPTFRGNETMEFESKLPSWLNSIFCPKASAAVLVATISLSDKLLRQKSASPRNPSDDVLEL